MTFSTSTIGYICALNVNAVLTILLIGLAWRSAVAHQIAAHRRWALRAYVVANGQWFMRVGLFGWILINRGPFLIGKNFDGPFILFWDFGAYLLPLLILELYLHVKEGTSPRGQFAMAVGLAAVTVFMGIGIFGVAAVMWWPTPARL